MLSSRVSRRNKCGFKGEGSYDDKFHAKRMYANLKEYDNKGKTHADMRHEYFVKGGERYGCRHSGSKRHRQLRLYMKPAPGGLLPE